MNRLAELTEDAKKLVEQEYLSRLLFDEFIISGIKGEYDGLGIANVYRRLHLTTEPVTTKAELIRNIKDVCLDKTATNKQHIANLIRLYEIKFDTFANYYNSEIDDKGDYVSVFRNYTFWIGNKQLGHDNGLRYLSLTDKEEMK